MQPFQFGALPGRVIFGFGTLSRIADEISALGCRRALLLSTPGQRAKLEALGRDLGDLTAGLFTQATMHTPVTVTEAALAVAKQVNADCVIAYGGGSTIGLGKAIALRTDLPQIVIPTTYAGSEATPVIGETANGQKVAQTTAKVLPEVIVYDVDLTLTLPVKTSTTSGMNAIAHAVEALYSQDANPLTSLIAVEAIKQMTGALPRIKADTGDRDARSDALYAAWFGGLCMAGVGMALHHKLCHTLGGSFGLPHAETHTVILPHAVAYNAAAPALAMLHPVLGADVAGALYDLNKKLDNPMSLQTLGMKAQDLDRACEIAMQKPYWNPVPLDGTKIRALLQRAFDGTRPN